MKEIKIGDKIVGEDHPVFVIADIGINHNGDIEIAKKLIRVAKEAKCDAVKFQKRTPELCVPPEQRDILRETPWGVMTYLDYRKKIELGYEKYLEIDSYCKENEIIWFASSWDLNSVDFLNQFDLPCYKVPSALLTFDKLLLKIRKTGKPIILSTGMSTMEQIKHAVEIIGTNRLLLAHCVSIYPSPSKYLNLKVIQTLQREFNCIVGYSGHEVGLATTFAAVSIGARFIERHITLDRAMWGTDQAASVEPHGMSRLVEKIRDIEIAFGDGVKRVLVEEMENMKKLRYNDTE
jgi:N-acetylneuraminate synthase